MQIQLKSKTKTVFVVSIDNEIWGILPARILQFFSLLPEGKNELTEDRKNDLILDLEKYAWDRFLNFLTYRERSVEECSIFLKILPLHSILSEKLLQKAIDRNFVNDDRFADLYVQDLIAKNRSQRQIRTKLIEKHINNTLIEKYLSEHFSSEQKKTILDVNFMKAVNRFYRVPEKKRKEKILNYLTRKGFTYSEVKQKLDEEDNNE
jgi:regulatory protein